MNFYNINIKTLIFLILTLILYYMEHILLTCNVPKINEVYAIGWVRGQSIFNIRDKYLPVYLELFNYTNNFINDHIIMLQSAEYIDDYIFWYSLADKFGQMEGMTNLKPLMWVNPNEENEIFRYAYDEAFFSEYMKILLNNV